MKMPCLESETIAAFVDGTLPSDDRTRVIAHLATCDECAHLVAEVAATSDELSSPAETSLARAAQVETSFLRPSTWRRRGAATAAVLALAATVGLVVYNRGS